MIFSKNDGLPLKYLFTRCIFNLIKFRSLIRFDKLDVAKYLTLIIYMFEVESNQFIAFYVYIYYNHLYCFS